MSEERGQHLSFGICSPPLRSGLLSLDSLEIEYSIFVTAEWSHSGRKALDRKEGGMAQVKDCHVRLHRD